jgi:deoxyribose-phosphate aldolase
MTLESRIEHTLLSTGATQQDIEKLCDEAQAKGFRGVCVPPYFVKAAIRKAEKQAYKVITVVDFPFGYSHTTAKVEGIKRASDQGVSGVDIVVNYCSAINQDWATFENDINTVVQAAKMRDLEVKLILETGTYSSKVLKRVVEKCCVAEPDFLKTNTGTMGNVATLDQVKLIRRFSEDKIPIKASGGIREREQAEMFIDNGVAVIGTSSAAKW